MAIATTAAYRPKDTFTENGTPPNYQVRIYSNKTAVKDAAGRSSGKTKAVTLTSNLPEQFSLSVSSTWNDPLNKSFTDSAPDGASTPGFFKKGLEGIKVANGQTTLSKYQTVHVWQSGAPMELTIPMVFRAFNDPVADVTDKVVTLMSMVCPYTEGSMLHAPGPTLWTLMGDATAGEGTGELITIELGNFIRMQPVIITSVNVDFDTKFDRNGNPMSATANVAVQTPFIVTRSDIAEYFVTNNSYYKGQKDAFSMKGLFDFVGGLLGIKDMAGYILPD